MANGYNDEFFNGDDQSQSLENDAREIGDIAKDVKNIADKVKDHRGKDANEDTNGTNAGSKNVPSGANNVGGANQVQPNAAQAGGDAAANMSTSGAPGCGKWCCLECGSVCGNWHYHWDIRRS